MKNFGSKRFNKKVKHVVTSNKGQAITFKLNSSKVMQEKNSTYQLWRERGLVFHHLEIRATLSCLNLMQDNRFHHKNYCLKLLVREIWVQKTVQKLS